jgi:hypothetical protein
MKRKNQLFKSYVNFLNQKTKKSLSYDFYVKSVYGFLKFKCFFNFFNFKSYFDSFNRVIEKKKSLTEVFYHKYKAFY